MDSITKPLTVTIVGTGNVATHLFKALSTKKPEVIVNIVNSRTLKALPDYSDIIIISVKDDAIGEVAQRVAGKAKVIAHTSGSVSIDVLKNTAEDYGVFYPLQTFSKNKELDYKEIPLFIEGNSKKTTEALQRLGQLITDKIYEADSNRRKRLHIAAVFACNFSNHLVAIADSLLKEEGLDYGVLMPLLNETVGKLKTLSPIEAQTGPAIRDDKTVMDAHLKMLDTHPEWQTLYKLLSESIKAW